MNPRQMAKIKSEKHEQKQGTHTHTHTHTHEAKTYQRKQSTRVTWQEKESKKKKDINQLKTKLTKTHNRKQDQSRVPNED